ncbi:MAG: VOC family protein [Acidimicrobiia bacterium]
MSGLAFDHVMLAARDIDVAAGRLWTEHGLASVIGGRHPGHGTGNRIVPLGDSYLEIIGIVDREEAAVSALGGWIQHHTREGDRLLGLCLRAYDLAVVAARLDLSPVSMNRRRGDGAVLSWSLVGLDETLADPGRPFFIQWDSRELHPGREAASHRVEPAGMAWVETGADEAELRRWVGDDSLDLRAVEGPRGVAAVGIGTAHGVLELRN